MKKFDLKAPAPFLKGIYVREDFNFDKSGTALDVETPRDFAAELSAAEDEATPQQSALMSDDDLSAIAANAAGNQAT